MTNIDKLKAAAAKAVDNFDPNMFVETRDVLALLDELEAKDKLNAELMEKQRLIDICQGQGLEYRIAAEKRAETAEKRVAELEVLARGVKQFSEFQICHYGATEDYAKGYIDCQNNYNKVLFAAAGKGEAS